MKRKATKLLAFIFGGLILTGLLPVTVLAVDVQVGSSAELGNAINSASNGDIITVDKSLTLSGVITIPSGKDITIKGIDGADIALFSANGNIRHFVIQSGAVVVFENITLDGNSNGGGIQNAGGLTLNSGTTIQNCAIGFGNGGGIQNNSGQLTMNSGAVIQNCNVTGRFGGGIFNSGGVVTINGGLISGNTATNGGGLYNSIGGTLTINGGKISGNTATGGGGIGNASSGMLTINDGEIIGNTATSSGGGINNATNCVVYIEGGLIAGNISQNLGGGISNNSGTVNVNDGVITNNGATANGGGIYNVSGMVNIAGGIIHGNSTRLGGGVFNTTGGAITVSGGKICSNTAVDGGGIYSSIPTSSVVISGTSIISNNTATGNGGGINITNPLTISGGVISGNTAVSGGGIYTTNLQNITISNGVVFSNNKATTARWMTNVNDIALHNEKIGDAVIFSEPPEGNAPFDYAYNNYDVSYASGNTSKPVTVTRYTVRFVDWDGSVISTQSVEHGMTAVAPPAPARNGYTFVGWNPNPSITPIIADTVFTAVWEEIDPCAIDHDWGDWMVTTPATCTAAGVETRICANDASHTESRIITALGHDFDNDNGVYTYPNCLTDGFWTYFCICCDATDMVIITGSALGHDYVPTVINGKLYNVCSRCNDMISVDFDFLTVTTSNTNLQNNTTVTLTVYGNYNGVAYKLAAASVKLKQNGTQAVSIGGYAVTAVVNSNNKITNCYIGVPTSGSSNQNSQGDQNKQ